MCFISYIGVLPAALRFYTVDLMSVSGPGEPGKGSKARALPWTRQGHSPWNQPVGVCGIGLSSLHPMTRGAALKG